MCWSNITGWCWGEEEIGDYFEQLLNVQDVRKVNKKVWRFADASIGWIEWKSNIDRQSKRGSEWNEIIKGSRAGWISSGVFKDGWYGYLLFVHTFWNKQSAIKTLTLLVGNIIMNGFNWPPCRVHCRLYDTWSRETLCHLCRTHGSRWRRLHTALSCTRGRTGIPRCLCEYRHPENI